MSNKECDIVQDLLPLYYDNACSEESRRFVEKHLPGCNDCQKMYNELKENNVDEVLAGLLLFQLYLPLMILDLLRKSFT